MNQHTAKLLKKHARNIQHDFRLVKKWWETLNWMERTAWRVKIEASLPPAFPNSTEVAETTKA